MKVVIVALLSVLAVHSQSAIKLAISEGAVQTILTLLEETEGKQLAVLELGNYTYDVGGGVTVDIYNTFAHTNISFKHPNIFFQAPNIANINFTDLTSIIYFNYTENEGPLHIHGYGNMTVPSVNLTIEAAFSEYEGSLTVDLPNTVAYIANVTLETGSVFNKALEDKINSELWLIELVIPQLLTVYVPKINLVLAGITKYLPIPQLGAMLDIHVADDPVIEAENAVLAFKGEVLSYPYREPIGAFNPPKLPGFTDAYTLQAMFSDYLVQVSSVN